MWRNQDAVHYWLKSLKNGEAALKNSPEIAQMIKHRVTI